VGLMIYFSFKVKYIKSKVLKLGNNYKSTKSSRILKEVSHLKNIEIKNVALTIGVFKWLLDIN
jgi:hypothetical protein